MYTVQCTVNILYWICHTQFSWLNPPPYNVHTALYTMYTIHFTPYTVHHTMHTIIRIFYTVHCTPYSVHRTLYIVHRTLYNIYQARYPVYLPYAVHWPGALSTCGMPCTLVDSLKPSQITLLFSFPFSATEYPVGERKW